MTDTKLTRIAALLRKAESTDNEFEAAAFMEAAQRLATLESVDLAVARAHTACTERRAEPTQRTIQIGERGKRGLKTYVKLFLAIGRANDITCDIAQDSTRVYTYGFATDIDATEALYSSLVVQMVKASDAYLKSDERKSETVERWNQNSWEYDVKPLHGTVARTSFMNGFTRRIGDRLSQARREAQATAVAATPTANTDASTTSVEMVLRDKQVEIKDFYKSKSDAKGSWKGFRSSGQSSSTAVQAGDRAGRSARLGGEKAIGGSRTPISS